MTDPQRVAPARLMLGDCVEMMQQFDADSVDAVVTDPPYGIGFMGYEWDQPDQAGSRWGNVTEHGRGHYEERRSKSMVAGEYDQSPAAHRAFQEWTEGWASEALRVLKPGGHAVVFGGTRTFHRMTSGLEDAGFEIRDCLAWMFGQGFPKSMDVARQVETHRDAEAALKWEGWGTALKPGFEPITLARKPLPATVAANVLQHGTGALNIDACRIEAMDPQLAQKYESVRNAGLRENSVYNKDPRLRSEGRVEPHEAGRWPANVLLDPHAADLLDAQTGDLAAGNHPAVRNVSSTFTANAHGETPNPFRTDAGGASRFFYVAKTSRAERNAGLDGFTPRALSWSSGDQSPGTFQSDGTDRTARNHHPTVKPIALMRWLCRLVTPAGGLILDPFLGSGTTGIAAALEGFEFAGAERDSDYMDIARARIAFWAEHGEDGLRICAEREAAERDRVERADAGQLDLFAAEA